MVSMSGMKRRKDYSIEELSRIVGPIAARHKIVHVWLFGSHARGNHGPDSDYDFCILIPYGTSISDVGAFIEETGDALGADVDIAYEDYVSDRFRRDVRGDMSLIYDATKGMITIGTCCYRESSHIGGR